MKHVITIFLAVVGLALLIAGYTDPQRGKIYVEAYNNAFASIRMQTGMQTAQREAKKAGEKVQSDYDYSIKHPEEKGPDPMLAKIDELLAKIDELTKRQSDLLDITW